MKFEIFCDRCMKMREVKIASMGTGGRIEVQLKCKHWVYLEIIKYEHCGQRLKVSEIEKLWQERKPYSGNPV